MADNDCYRAMKEVMTAVGQHATLERGPPCICAKIGSFLLISSANLDPKIINLSIKWQPNIQINNWVPLWQIEQSQLFANILFTDIENANQKDHICRTFTEY